MQFLSFLAFATQVGIKEGRMGVGYQWMLRINTPAQGCPIGRAPRRMQSGTLDGPAGVLCVISVCSHEEQGVHMAGCQTRWSSSASTEL